MGRPMSKHLVITADDFGLSPEVNEAVEQGAPRRRPHRRQPHGRGAGRAPMPSRARGACPGLRVGLHLALVEAQARACRPARFPISSTRPAGSAATRPLTARRSSSGLGCGARSRPRSRPNSRPSGARACRLDHVNAHQHFHLHPTIAGMMIAHRPALSACEPYGCPAEPHQPRAGDRSRRPRWALAGHHGALDRACWARGCAGPGCRVPDQVFGLAWTGAMTARADRGLIDRLPHGLTEIYTHPATADGFEGAAPGYRYAEELAGSLAPVASGPRSRAAGASLGGFGDALAVRASSPVERAVRLLARRTHQGGLEEHRRDQRAGQRQRQQFAHAATCPGCFDDHSCRTPRPSSWR